MGITSICYEQIAWDQAFRGHAVKTWDRICEERYFNMEINCVLIKKCTSHHMNCWKERNEQCHEPTKQREYVTKWSKTLESKILRSNKTDAMRCLRNNKVNYELKTTACMQQRNRYLMSVLKDSKEERNNRDMRSDMKINEDEG